MSLIVYTLLRVLLVVAAGALLYLAGMRGVLLVAVAVLVGAMLSFVLLKGPRDRAAATLKAFAEREPRVSEPDADALAEDSDLDGGMVPEADGATRVDQVGGEGSVSAEPEDQGERDAER